MADLSGSPGIPGRIERLKQRVRELGGEGVPLPGEVFDELWQVVEQLEAENEELQETRNRAEALQREFADLYEHAPTGYVILNPRRLVERANQTARRMLGPDALVAGVSAIGPLIAPESQDAFFAALRHARDERAPQSAEICVAPAGEEPRWLLVRVVCDRDGADEVARYRMTLAEITARVIAERTAEARRMEIEELVEEKELLLRELHHRVKNDLHLMSSFLSLQSARSPHEEVKRAMDEARSRVTVLTRIYDTLHRQTQYTRVPVDTIVRDVVSGFEHGVAGPAFQVAAELEPATVSTRVSLAFGLIVNELLTNVGKHAMENHTRATVAIRLRKLPADEVELVIADDGRGFPEDVVDGRVRGFGLTVVAALVGQHNGSLEIANDHGAKVTMRMRGL